MLLPANDRAGAVTLGHSNAHQLVRDPPPPPPKCSYRADGATLGQLSKALGGKAAPSDAPQDLLAAVWGFAQLNHKPDAGLLTKASAAIKGAAGQLTAEQQVRKRVRGRGGVR
jgi:hypothetical protein